MSKERARRRAERDAVKAREAHDRARLRQRAERRARRGEAVRSLIPSRGRRVDPLLARRRRRRALILGGVVGAIQVVAWPLIGSWGGRLLLLSLCLMVLPVAWVVVFDRRA